MVMPAAATNGEWFFPAAEDDTSPLWKNLEVLFLFTKNVDWPMTCEGHPAFPPSGTESSEMERENALQVVLFQFLKE